MRLLQLATGPNQVLDLHPNVTIVTGLDDDTHKLLVGAVAGLARGEAPEGGGLLEAHGVLFDLDAALLGVIDQTQAVDPIVHPGQLPSQPISVDAEELRQREQEFTALLDQISRHAEEQSLARGAASAVAAALDDARRARSGAESAADTRVDDVAQVTRRLEELAEECNGAEAELHELRSQLNVAQEARIELERAAASEREATLAARALLSTVEAEPAAPEVELAAAAPLALRLERLEERTRELDLLLAVVVPVERFAIEEALAMLEGGDSTSLVASGEAAAVADELDWVSAELGDPNASEGDEVGEASLADARTRLDVARQSLLDAEQAVRNPELDRGDVTLLEDAHAHLVEAAEKVTGRRAGSRASRRVLELRAAEQEVLDRLGFTSYSDYMMGNSVLHVDPAKEEALTAAQAELAAAEVGWSKLERDADAALSRAAMLDRRRELLEQARELLGRVAPGGRPQEALRALRIPTVSTLESARRLHARLETVGVELGDEDLDNEELALVSEAWLSEVDQVDGRRHAALEERTTLEAERGALLVELDAQAHAAAAADRGTPGEPLGPADLEPAAVDFPSEADDELATALAVEASLAERVLVLDEQLARSQQETNQAQATLQALSAPPADLATLDANLEAAEARHADAAAALETADRVLAAIDAQGRAAALEIERLQDIVDAQEMGLATPAEELEWYLLARLASQRSVSVAGSVPLLLDDALRGLGADEVSHLLGRLERMAEAVQVIIVSDDPVVALWAHTAGPARAAVAGPATP